MVLGFIKIDKDLDPCTKLINTGFFFHLALFSSFPVDSLSSVNIEVNDCRSELPWIWKQFTSIVTINKLCDMVIIVMYV